MRLNILIAGAAGQGINEISNILAKALACAGYYVFNYREYGSYIAGGHNFNVLCLSDKPINAHENDFDVVIALNEDVIKRYSKNFKKNVLILSSQDYKLKKSPEGTSRCQKISSEILGPRKSGDFRGSEKRSFSDIKNLIKIEIDNSKIENVYYAAALFKIMGLDKSILVEYINKVFAGKAWLKEDLEAVEKSYSIDYKINLGLNSNGKTKQVFTGAEACGIAAIESGLQIYLAYPMTPATSLLSFMAQHQKKYNYLVYQPENEIAVANAALGVSFSGAIAMIGTAGGGYDLMTEALSMSGMAELPLVVYLAQRPGPSTGIPTYSMQTDINVALYGGHGEFSRIVVCPGDVEDSYRLTKEAFYLSQKYKSPGIILTDKHLAESYYTIDKLEEYNIKINKPNKILGKDLIKASSYEHDELGNTIEIPEEIKKRFDLRLKKWDEMKKEVSKMKTYSIYRNKNAKKIIISTGSNKGAIIDALKELKDYEFIQINYLEPFADIKKELKGKEVYTLETNSTGALADLIQKNIVIEVPMKNRILKYDALPFTASDVVKLLGGERLHEAKSKNKIANGVAS